MVWTRTISSPCSSSSFMVPTPPAPRFVFRYPSRSCFTSPVLKSMTGSPCSSTTGCISPSPRRLRLAIPNFERVRTCVSSFDVAIIPTTLSPSLSFIPRTPAVTRPWTLTVNPIEPSGFSFVALGLKRQARPFFETRTTWSSSVAARTATSVSESVLKFSAYFPFLLIRVYSSSFERFTMPS